MDRIKNGWKANLIRIGMNQASYMTLFPGIYPKELARVVKWAEAAGMDVILDLHWTDNAHPSSTSGYMASVASGSDAFWKAVATAYKDDPHVMFELYNEPTVQWADWKTNYQALYDAVRSTGAKNIVIIGGIDWAYDLSQVFTTATSRITGTNIAYNTHPYGNKAPATDWDAKFGNLAGSFPVFATEFGTYDCTGSWTQSLITYMEGKGMSWTAWAWYVAPTGAGCAFPSLISDYSGTLLNGANSNADATFQGLKKNP
jgi:aryl-phospho-beta-D-glucosidase BglC (GH1 family)